MDVDDILWHCLWASAIGGLWGGFKGVVIACVFVYLVHPFCWLGKNL